MQNNFLFVLFIRKIANVVLISSINKILALISPVPLHDGHFPVVEIFISVAHVHGSSELTLKFTWRQNSMIVRDLFFSFSTSCNRRLCSRLIMSIKSAMIPHITQPQLFIISFCCHAVGFKSIFP